MVGLALNYSDLVYFPCGKGIYLGLLLCNQCYLITYFHPLFHGPLYIIKKIVMLSYFDNIRKKVKRCLEKAGRACRKFLVCRNFLEKMENYCKIQKIYEVDHEKAKEITDRFA